MSTPPAPVPPVRRRAFGDQGPTRGALLSAVVAVLIVFALIASITVFQTSAGVQAIPYREFKQRVRSDRVAEVVIRPDEIRGTLKLADRASRFRTTRVDDPSLVDDLEQHGVNYSGEAATGWMSTVLGVVVPLLFLFVVWSFVMRRAAGGAGAITSFGQSRAKLYAEDDVKVSFSDVAGIDDAVAELREIVDFLKKPGKYTVLGGRIPKGVLLLGPPGTGKTLLARAVAGEAHVPFFSLSASEFVEMFVGVGAARVRDLFEQAERSAPCIIFIDELDALGKTRALPTAFGGHEEREQTLNQLLAQMDGFDPSKGVIVMAATNRPEVLDPALLRPGRFDRHVVVDRPDIAGREAILRLHVQKLKLGPDVDPKLVAARTAGFAGADLANLVNEAALLAARKEKARVEMEDFDEAIERMLVGLKKKRVMSEKERTIVAFHESGHAIVGSVLPGLDPVHKVSIVQRGIAALGHTLQSPVGDRYVSTRDDLLNQLTMLLGGRAAEKMVLREISTGAQNDLLRATDIARAMVMQFGMSEALGAVNYEGHKGQHLIEPYWSSERGNYAEDTARTIDQEVKRLITDADDQARRILGEHRDVLDALAHRLLEKEVVEGTELRAMLPARSRPSVPDVHDGAERAVVVAFERDRA